MSLQTMFGPARAATRLPQCGGTSHAGVGTWLRSAMGLLAGRRERIRARQRLRNLYELDDHILKDIGLTRSALRRQAETPFWL
jgi:uncharacterized protein YjiS (DUF1127 family)